MTRPITNRVKVSLFDWLAPVLDGARVADIYSGTGTIGLEALSRGADRVLFIEQDRVAFDLLRQNISELKVAEETLAWRVDATKCSFRPKNGDEFLPFDLIFFDPPYFHTERMKKDTMLYKALIRLANPAISAPGVWLMLRCGTGTDFEMPPVWRREKLLEYSSMSIHLFVKSDQPEMGELLNPQAPSDTAPDSDPEDSDPAEQVVDADPEEPSDVGDDAD